MAVLSDAGIEPHDLDYYVGDLERRFRAALGDDLNVDPETPQGQLIGVLALALAQVDELAVHVANGMNVHTAAGRQLDDLGSLYAIARQRGYPAFATVRIYGEVGAVIPAGLRLASQSGTLFILQNDNPVTIPAAGFSDQSAWSQDNGPQNIAAGQLNRILDVVEGLERVENRAAIRNGRYAESDVELRRRLLLATSLRTTGFKESIRAGLLSLDNVDDARVEENAAATPATILGTTIAAHSIAVAVDGSASASTIANMINSRRPLGIGTSGAINENGIYFTRVARVPLAVTVSTVAGDGFPANGNTLITERLAAWSRGEWSPDGQFDASGFAIGEAVDTNLMFGPVLSVPGHAPTSITATKADGSAIGQVTLATRYTLDAANITVS